MSSAQETDNHRSSVILRLLIPLLGSDYIGILAVVWRLGRRILAFKTQEGIYEVLDLDARLELQDSKGHKAILYKRERVRFLQDNIIAYQDKAWGDGKIFADYKCSPGVAVDRYRDGYRYRILISLRETKNRGNIEEFQIERTIQDGFTKPVEDFQIDIDHTTQKLSLSAVFPRKRIPKRVLLIERNTTRAIALGAEHIQTRPDGRQQVVWRTERPRLFEGYILRWEW
jgi:hypothetical protein